MATVKEPLTIDAGEPLTTLNEEPPVGVAPRRGGLLRVLGVVFGMAVTIGITIGMGILRTPGDVAKQLPNAWLFIGVWLLGGVYALLGAVSVAELGTMIPRSGGFYVFAEDPAHRLANRHPERRRGRGQQRQERSKLGCKFGPQGERILSAVFGVGC